LLDLGDLSTKEQKRAHVYLGGGHHLIMERSHPTPLSSVGANGAEQHRQQQAL
jgi:uracil DNA glycosylase